MWSFDFGVMEHGLDGLDTDFNKISENPCPIRAIRVPSNPGDLEIQCQTGKAPEAIATHLNGIPGSAGFVVESPL